MEDSHVANETWNVDTFECLRDEVVCADSRTEDKECVPMCRLILLTILCIPCLLIAIPMLFCLPKILVHLEQELGQYLGDVSQPGLDSPSDNFVRYPRRRIS